MRNITAGTGERAQYVVHEFNDTTIRFVLHYPGLVDPDILCRATEALVRSVNVLHGSFHAGNVRAYWQINEALPVDSYFQYVRVADAPEVTACSLAVLPIRFQDLCQLRCILVQSSTESAITLLMSHLVMDGSDGKYMLSKLVEAYNLILETGSADALEIKNGDRSPEQIYENMTRQDKRALLKNPLSSAKSLFPYPTQEPGFPRYVKTVIPAATMTAARKRGKIVSATVNDILLAAFYRAYASLPQVDANSAMGVSAMMDARRHCKGGDSAGLSNISGSLATTLEQGVSGSFADTLAEVASKTAQIKEDPLGGLYGMPLLHGAAKNLPLGLLVKGVGIVYGSMSLGLTNLGNLSCAAHALGVLVPDGGMFGGPLKKKPGMQVSVMSFDGACTLSVVGQYTEEDASALQETLDTMCREIAEFAFSENAV